MSNLAHTRILPVAAQSNDVSDYFHGLTSTSFASQSSRYNRMSEDVNADRLLIGPFRANAMRVVSMDRVRMRTVESSPDVAPEKQDPALARVVENEGLVFWVCERLDFRLGFGRRFFVANVRERDRATSLRKGEADGSSQSS